jgi:hypothetical protein
MEASVLSPRSGPTHTREDTRLYRWGRVILAALPPLFAGDHTSLKAAAAVSAAAEEMAAIAVLFAGWQWP